MIKGPMIKEVTHIKNQGNCNLNEKRQSSEANTEMSQMLELCDKDFIGWFFFFLKRWERGRGR